MPDRWQSGPARPSGPGAYRCPHSVMVGAPCRHCDTERNLERQRDEVVIGFDAGVDQASIVVARRTPDGLTIVDELHRHAAEAHRAVVAATEAHARRVLRERLPRGARWVVRYPRLVALLFRLRPSLRPSITITTAS